MILNRKFYNRNTIQVAQDLLGCFLVRKYRGKIIRAMITETEAYHGEDDLACHASKGRTPRTEILYGEPGRAYVYMIYGMYFMLNAVTEEKDFPAAVLIRGVEILPETQNLKPSFRNFLKLGFRLDGPGKLTKFLHIDKSLNNWDLTRGEKLWIELGHPMSKKFKIKKSPRVGIDYAKH
jgi:DNA-3-methyladenine glycosylase